MKRLFARIIEISRIILAKIRLKREGCYNLSGLTANFILALSIILSIAVFVAEARFDVIDENNGTFTIDCKPWSVIGKRYSYKIEYQSNSIYDLSGVSDSESSSASPLGSSIKVQLSGIMNITSVGNNLDTIFLVYSLHDLYVDVSMNEIQSEKDNELLRTNLQNPILAYSGEDGNLHAISFGNTSHNLSQSFFKTILSMSRFIFPDITFSIENKWRAVEDDPNGRVKLQYQIIKVDSIAGKGTYDSIISLSKSRLGYMRPKKRKASDIQYQSPTILPEGTINATWNIKNGFPISIAGEQANRFLMGDKVIAESRDSININLTGDSLLTTAEKSQIQNWISKIRKFDAKTPFYVPPQIDDETEKRNLQKLLNGESGTDILNKLIELDSSGTKTGDTQTFLKLKAFIQLNPQSCRLFGDYLSQTSSEFNSMRQIALALGSVGHKEAQEALATAIKTNSDNWNNISIIVPLLGNVSNPTEFSIRTVKNLLKSGNKNIKMTARLALANMARNLVYSSPQLAEEIVLDIIKKADSLKANFGQRQLISILGNTGSIHVLPILEQALSDSSAQVRRAAVSALRWINDKQVDSILSRILIADKNSKIRHEVIKILSQKELTDITFSAQKEALLYDNNDAVRIGAMNSLWKDRFLYPEINSLVKEISENDRSSKVQEAASKLTMEGNK